MATKAQLKKGKKSGTKSKSKNPKVGKNITEKFSAYQIMWLAIFPVKGRPTKTDQKLIEREIKAKFPAYRLSNTGISFLLHCPSDEKANAIIRLLKIIKSVKRYKIYKFTDKQFGNASKNGELFLWPNGNAVKLTAKQKKSVVYFGKNTSKQKVSVKKSKSLSGPTKKFKKYKIVYAYGTMGKFYTAYTDTLKDARHTLKNLTASGGIIYKYDDRYSTKYKKLEHVSRAKTKRSLSGPTKTHKSQRSLYGSNLEEGTLS